MTAAAVTVSTGTLEDPSVVVLASGRDRRCEAWVGRVVARDGEQSVIAEWREAHIGGPVMSMLHLGVRNDGMVLEHGEEYGVSEEFRDPTATLERGGRLGPPS